jgi:hypothetical protein
MKGSFTVRIGRDLFTYDDTDKIPQEFDFLISFLPDYPKGPHTEIQHEEIASFMDMMKELQSRERKI